MRAVGIGLSCGNVIVNCQQQVAWDHSGCAVQFFVGRPSHHVAHERGTSEYGEAKRRQDPRAVNDQSRETPSHENSSDSCTVTARFTGLQEKDGHVAIQPLDGNNSRARDQIVHLHSRKTNKHGRTQSFTAIPSHTTREVPGHTVAQSQADCHTTQPDTWLSLFFFFATTTTPSSLHQSTPALSVHGTAVHQDRPSPQSTALPIHTLRSHRLRQTIISPQCARSSFSSPLSPTKHAHIPKPTPTST